MKLTLIIIAIVLGVLLLIVSLLLWRLVNPVGKVAKLKDANAVPVQQERLYADVKALTSIRPYRNHANDEGMQQSIHFIQNALQQASYKTKLQSFQTPNGKTYQNVIAFYGDVAKPRVVVGAHYDVCGDQDGADDNASAVAGMLEIARLLQEKKPDLPYCIELVAYANEEPPYFTTPYMGSAVHARALKQQNIKVKAMICLEMLGYFSDAPHSQHLPLPFLTLLYSSTANFIAVVGKWEQTSLVSNVKRNMLKAGNIQVFSINSPNFVTGIDFSDHRNYWAEGFEAVMITDTSFFRNPHYHQKTDTIETLDFKRMTEVVKGAYWATIHL
jgi:Zn-dependent M28 family amino/carboxypeptidase